MLSITRSLPNGLRTGLAAGLMLLATGAFAQSPPATADLDDAFRGAQTIDLRTSKVASVLILRDEARIPPPAEPVRVKVFERDKLPAVLGPAFSKPGIAGVTIYGRYVAILKTEFRKEYDDTLSHELVHAYVTLASPKPLPFWFQEGGAVRFSMGKARKFYGQPSKTERGVMIGRVVEVDPTYKQKLQTFNYLIDKFGRAKFLAWYRHSVETGVVDPNILLRPGRSSPTTRAEFTRPVPVWLWIVIGSAAIGAIVGLVVSRRSEYY